VSDDDEPITLHRVLTTIACGVVVGLLVSGLCVMASETYRERWLLYSLIVIGFFVLLFAWFRLLPWWSPSPMDWF
jgi:hypothetical protein